ncbi:MAG: hypothetical protein GY874_17730 [Desulfobacteraceae bacterium]|nr:hypothetical protein [Desulfobacteraceae bacterium]
MTIKKYLVVLGVPSIKKYVFGTDRLKEIRGASAIIEDFIRNRIAEYFRELPQLQIETVFVGGGSGHYIVHAEDKTVKEVFIELEGEFLKKTCGGARLNWGKAEYTKGNYHLALKLAELDATRKLEENPLHAYSQIHNGFIRECDSCGGLIEIKNGKYQYDNRILCDICLEKTKYSSQTRKTFFNNLSEYLNGKGINVKQPDTFEDIGEQADIRKGYVALVYADGNAMGRLIKDIDTQEHFRFFSHTVDNSIKIACHEALNEVFCLDKGQHSKVIPAEILMLGGDDLLVYLTAEKAFAFAIKVAEKFNALTRKEMETKDEGDFFLSKLESKGLTLSLGIAFDKSHTPFSILLDQAEELLAYAKKAGSEDPKSSKFYSPEYIDFHI